MQIALFYAIITSLTTEKTALGEASAILAKRLAERIAVWKNL
jgi:hypothetical protein